MLDFRLDSTVCVQLQVDWNDPAIFVLQGHIPNVCSLDIKLSYFEKAVLLKKKKDEKEK